MKKGRRVQKQPAWSYILDAESKLKALSWLLESQDPNCPLRPPWDMRDVYCGFGKMLWELSEKLAKVRRDLEEDEIQKARVVD